MYDSDFAGRSGSPIGKTAWLTVMEYRSTGDLWIRVAWTEGNSVDFGYFCDVTFASDHIGCEGRLT
jgi:hypothetical protein